MLSGVRPDCATAANRCWRWIMRYPARRGRCSRDAAPIAKLRPRPPARCRLCPRGRREVWVDNRHSPAVALKPLAAGALSGRGIHLADANLVDLRPGGCRYPSHRNPVIDDVVDVANDRG